MTSLTDIPFCSLSPLATLLAAPLSIPDLLPVSLRELLLSILTIPLLPSRLLPALAPFSVRLPLASLDLVPLDIIHDPALPSIESKIRLLANLAAFAPPRYSALPIPAFATYLLLCALLMNGVPEHALEPPENKPDETKIWADEGSDDEADTLVEAKQSPRPQLDERTRKRLQTLPSSIT